MKVLERALLAVLLGPAASVALDSLASSVLFTTVRINTGICTPTQNGSGNNNESGGNSTSNSIGGKVYSQYGVYDFLGYYPIPETRSMLKGVAGETTNNSAMTLELCAAFCKGTTYFDVQNGDQCLCSDDPPIGIPIKTAYPTIPCPGNKAEICGALGYGVVYAKESGNGSFSSSASNEGPVTVIVTGVTTDTAGIHTFTFTEVLSSATIITAITGTATTIITPTSSAPASGSAQSETYTSGEPSANSTSSNGNVGASSNSFSTTGNPSSNDFTGSSSAGASSSTIAGSSSSAGASSSTVVGGSSSAAASSSTNNAPSSSSPSPSASSTLQPTYPCPNSNGQQYTDSHGIVYDIACNTNYVGLPNPNDLPATDARTLTDCIADCDNYQPSPNVANGASCIAVTFGIGGTYSCYLKYQVETVQGDNPGFDSAKLDSYNPPNVSSNGGSSLTATTTSTRASSLSASPSTTSSGTSINSPGGSTASGSVTSTTTPSSIVSSTTSSLTTTSSSINTSPSITISSSTTTISTTVPSSTSTTIVSSASSSTYTFGPEQTSLTNPVCPTSNNTVFVDVFSFSYYIKCGLEIVGDNLYPVHADTFPKCLQYCDLIVGCAAVTYLDGAASTDANCYPYSSFLGYSPGASGIYSGVPQNGTSEGYPDAKGDPCAQGYNQSVFTDTFGNNYFIGCDQNVAGSGPPGGQDLRAYVADDLDGCLTYCSIYDTCVGVDFTGYPVQQNAANCYPKYTTGVITYQPGTKLAVYQA